MSLSKGHLGSRGGGGGGGGVGGGRGGGKHLKILINFQMSLNRHNLIANCNAFETKSISKMISLGHSAFWYVMQKTQSSL